MADLYVLVEETGAKRTFIQAETALGLALKLSVEAEEFRKRLAPTVWRPIPYRTLLHCEQIGSASGLNYRVVEADGEYLDVMGLTEEEAKEYLE